MSKVSQNTVIQLRKIYSCLQNSKILFKKNLNKASTLSARCTVKACHTVNFYLLERGWAWAYMPMANRAHFCLFRVWGEKEVFSAIGLPGLHCCHGFFIIKRTRFSSHFTTLISCVMQSPTAVDIEHIRSEAIFGEKIPIRRFFSYI